MNDDFTALTLAYLLDELDEPSRRSLEQRLERDPVAKSTFKVYADLLAEFALSESGDDCIPEAERAIARERILARVRTEQRRGVVFKWAYLWAAAAAMLMAFNVKLWLDLRQMGEVRVAGPASHGGLPELADRGKQRSQGVQERVSAEQDHFRPGPTVVETNQKGEALNVAALRQEYERLKAARDVANADYQHLLQEIAEASLVESGTDRFVAMQLVDPSTYATRQAGQTNSSQTLLSKPGIVPAGAPELPVNTPPQSSSQVATNQPGSTSSNPSSTTDNSPAPSSTASASPSSSGDMSGVSSVPPSPSGPTVAPPPGTTAPSDGGSGASQSNPSSGDGSTSTTTQGSSSTTGQNPATEGSSSSSITAQPSSAQTATPTAAWSLFDEANNEGFLDFSALPSVASNQTLEFWVQPTGTTTWVDVGSIPQQYYGGSGSVYYKLPSSTMVPGQVLITIEPKGAVPSAPSGTVVVRGP